MVDAIRTSYAEAVVDDEAVGSMEEEHPFPCAVACDASILHVVGTEVGMVADRTGVAVPETRSRTLAVIHSSWIL